METFKSLLQELDTVLRRYNKPAYENLLPPLSKIEAAVKLLEVGIDDENMRAFYQWKAGAQDEYAGSMVDYGVLITPDSIKEFIAFNEHYDKALIPFISDNEELLLFNTKQGPHYGKIYLFSVPQLYINYPISIYDSLPAMIKTIIEAYKTKAYEYDKDEDWLNIDYTKYRALCKQYNPNSTFWTDYDELRWEDWYAI